ncbi:hypothetical protein RJ639_032108 [Escallonia herrerae]|uniref:Protein phosphatase n=1 Tax=Escallonia herrerae TaxID=1293975 RepID=A0AA88X0C8_9ASTE|nr:hypothetical protein RJ639_032108 [Escallonia herrerae]
MGVSHQKKLANVMQCLCPGQAAALDDMLACSRSSLKMVAGSFYVPEKNELSPLGEDAHFICNKRQTIGLADGVSGSAKKGIDGGKFARELMRNCFPWSKGMRPVDAIESRDLAYSSSAASFAGLGSTKFMCAWDRFLTGDGVLFGAMDHLNDSSSTSTLIEILPVNRNVMVSNDKWCHISSDWHTEHEDLFRLHFGRRTAKGGYMDMKDIPDPFKSKLY